MISPRSLWTTFRVSILKSKPAHFSQFDPYDPFARFICSRSQFAAERNIVKPAAFLPNAKDLQLSVFHTKLLSSRETWEIGRRFVATPTNRTIYGRADFKADCVDKVHLRLHLDNHPPRHANIVGWPSEKSEQKLIAIQLAAMAALSLPSSPVVP